MTAARTPTRRLAMAMLAVASLAGTLSACGSGDDDAGGDDEVASLDDGSDDTTADTTTGTAGPEDMEDAVVAYAECMRDHGIDMPDPQVNEDGGIAIAIEGEPGNEAEMEAAQEACQPIMENARGEIDIDPEQQAEMQAQMLEFTECMRDHGIDMPDPQFSGDGRVTQTLDEKRGVDPSSEEFQAASEACGRDDGFIAAPSGGDGPATNSNGASGGDE